jgi:ATP synthase protein I
VKVDPISKKLLKESGSYSAVGLEMGIAVAIGYFLGSWLDSRLGTSPWLTYLFLFFGLGAAGLAVYRIYLKAKDLTEEPEIGPDGGQPKK